MAELILPPLRRSVADAIKFARIVHGEQRDKADRPYTDHLSRVAERVVDFSTDCPFWGADDLLDACQIAWLHDTVEDQLPHWYLLLREGFSHHVAEAVNTLTRKDGVRADGQRVTYDEWIRWLCETAPLPALLVKLADVEDNSDPERLALLDEATRERLTKKYAGAADLLRKAAREKGWQG